MNKTDMLNVMLQLHVGKDNKTPRTELCASAGYNDRKLREIIAQLREDGKLICNTDGGYYLAQTLDEVEEYYWREKKRAISIFEALRPFRKVLREGGRRV